MQASFQLTPVGTARQRRLLALSVAFIVAAAAVWPLQASQSFGHMARWPADDSLYALPGWTVSAAAFEQANGNVYITRVYQQTLAPTRQVTFTLTTGVDAKNVYRASADVQFLGNGFESEPLVGLPRPNDQVRGVSALRRGAERWLQVYAYGERRGFLGNGVAAWASAIFDTALGYPTDYYLLRVITPASEPDGRLISQLDEIAAPLFQRVADWYSASVPA